MKKPTILYITIIIICVIALALGVYYQFFSPKEQNNNNDNNNSVIQNKDQDTEQSQEEIKDEFNNLFTNKLEKKGYNTSNIEKVDPNKDIIYPVTLVRNEANYEMDINVPAFNIKSEITNQFNINTNDLFINKANEIITGKQSGSTNETNEILINTDTNTRVVYDINYQCYINGDILSVIIKSSLKEGDNPQRIMFQTYNYNLATKEKIELANIIEPYGLNKTDIEEQIKKVTTAADEQAKAIEQSGYTSYQRDLSSPAYQIENIHTFFLGKNGELYIVFAYGNNNYTSEMDIVKMETYPTIEDENSNETDESNDIENNPTNNSNSNMAENTEENTNQ